MKNLHFLAYIGQYGNYRHTAHHLKITCQFFKKLADEGHIKKFLFIDSGQFYYKNFIQPLKPFAWTNHLKPLSSYHTWQAAERNIITQTLPEIYRVPSPDGSYYSLYNREYIIDFVDIYDHFKNLISENIEKYEKLYQQDAEFKNTVDQAIKIFTKKNLSRIKLEYPELFNSNLGSEQRIAEIIAQGTENYLKTETLFQIALNGNPKTGFEIYPNNLNNITRDFYEKTKSQPVSIISKLCAHLTFNPENQVSREDFGVSHYASQSTLFKLEQQIARMDKLLNEVKHRLDENPRSKILD